MAYAFSGQMDSFVQKAIDTLKYPRQMGMPSTRPLRKAFFLFMKLTFFEKR